MPRRCHPRPGAVVLACLAAVALGRSSHAHDLERTTVHLTLARDGAFTLRMRTTQPGCFFGSMGLPATRPPLR